MFMFAFLLISHHQMIRIALLLAISKSFKMLLKTDSIKYSFQKESEMVWYSHTYFWLYQNQSQKCLKNKLGVGSRYMLFQMQKLIFSLRWLFILVIMFMLNTLKVFFTGKSIWRYYTLPFLWLKNWNSVTGTGLKNRLLVEV